MAVSPGNLLISHSYREIRSVSAILNLCGRGSLFDDTYDTARNVLGFPCQSMKTASKNSNPFRRYMGCSVCTPAVYVTKMGPLLEG